MPGNEERIKDLLLKHFIKEISPEEKAVLDAWAQKSPDNRQLLEDLHNDYVMAEKLTLYYSADSEAIRKKTMRQIEKHCGGKKMDK